MSRSGLLLDVNPANQWEWHESYRDVHRNQYRTTYSDMIHGRETYCKSDYPSGYGGHIPNVRFEEFFRNTAFHRKQTVSRMDPSRDAHPSFKDQLEGIPTYCNKPQGSRKAPSYKVVNHDGTTRCRAPWGVVTPVREPPSHRNVPATLARARSLPSVAKKTLERRPAWQEIGDARSFQKVRVPSIGSSFSRPGSATSLAKDPFNYETVDLPEGDTQDDGDNAGPLARTVTMANQEATRQRVVSEQEMLLEEMMDESGFATPASRQGGA